MKNIYQYILLACMLFGMLACASQEQQQTAEGNAANEETISTKKAKPADANSKRQFSFDSSEPAKVTEQFMQLFISGDFEAARQYGSQATSGLLDVANNTGMADKLQKEYAKKKAAGKEDKIAVKECKVEEGIAHCEIINESVSKDETLSIPLIKEGGQWKVDLSKESLNKENPK